MLEEVKGRTEMEFIGYGPHASAIPKIGYLLDRVYSLVETLKQAHATPAVLSQYHAEPHSIKDGPIDKFPPGVDVSSAKGIYAPHFYSPERTCSSTGGFRRSSRPAFSTRQACILLASLCEKRKEKVG